MAPLSFRESGWFFLQALEIAFNAIVPLFAVIAVGYFVRRRGWLGDQEVRHFNTVAFRTFMPVMIFENIYVSDFSRPLRGSLVLYALGCVVIMLALSAAVTLPAEKRSDRRGVMMQAMYRGNFVLLGLPIVQSLLPDGEHSVTVLLVAIVVPVFNALAVVTLEFFRGGHPSPLHIMLSVVKNPLILGSLAGILCRWLNLRLPAAAETFFSMMCTAATPVILFLLGASIVWRRMADCKRQLALCVVMRLVGFPALLLLPAAALGFRGVEFLSLMGVLAAPTAVNSFTMAQELGGDADLAAGAVVFSTALSFFTLFGWIVLFKSMGVF